MIIRLETHSKSMLWDLILTSSVASGEVTSLKHKFRDHLLLWKMKISLNPQILFFSIINIKRLLCGKCCSWSAKACQTCRHPSHLFRELTNYSNFLKSKSFFFANLTSAQSTEVLSGLGDDISEELKRDIIIIAIYIQ